MHVFLRFIRLTPWLNNDAMGLKRFLGCKEMGCVVFDEFEEWFWRAFTMCMLVLLVCECILMLIFLTCGQGFFLKFSIEK